MRRIPRNTVTALIGFFTLAPLSLSSAHALENTGPIPNMAGAWSRLTFGFERPESGPGPVGRLDRRSTGGNYNNPILRPEAAALVKQRTEMLLGGEDFPTPSNRCLPMVAPYLFRVQEMQMIQKKDEVIFLYMQDHQVRHIKLNQAHPAHITPSWYGDSVGHYENGTLVVDTIGAKLGPVPQVDMYGSPFSEALHVVERYRMIDYETAKTAQDRNIREQGPVATEQAAAIDETYRGDGLQIQFTVEDKNVFNTPWSGIATYRKAAGWVENVCAENPHEYYTGRDTDVPKADAPDF
jgi:hypothetical protein